MPTTLETAALVRARCEALRRANWDGGRRSGDGTETGAGMGARDSPGRR